MLPLAMISTAPNRDRAFPLPEPVDDSRAAGVGTDTSQAAQDPDHIPIHNPRSLGPGAGITMLGCAPDREGSWDAPRMERDTTHRPSWVGAEVHPKVEGRAKHTPGEPLACETQQQDPVRRGAGQQRGRCVY